MNSMHNGFSGPGGYPSGYPGYVPPPSALPYYNGYPNELNASSNPYYGKPGAPVPQNYPSGMNNYSGAMNNSPMYYQQYGLGYQYGYGKYGIGYSEPGIHPASIGALQTPTTDLGLTGSMFSKTKYSAAPTTNTNPTSTAATTPISSSSLLSPATSNTPSPGPHGLPNTLKGPEPTPSPPAELNDGKKDLDKMKRCQVCGQVFRLMSECLAHMKAAHEAPHSVYNLSHHGGACGPAGSSGASVPPVISASRHGGMGTPDSPLMALERMGWGEKQGALPLQSASSPMSVPYAQHGQQNHQVCMPHPHSGSQLYAGHPITRLASPSQTSIPPPGVTSGFPTQQPPGANASPVPPDSSSYPVSSETNISTEAAPKSKKNTCYSMSSIIGEKPVKIDTKAQNPFTVLGEPSQHTEIPTSSSSPIPCESSYQDGSGDQTSPTAQKSFCDKGEGSKIQNVNRQSVNVEPEKAPEVNKHDQENQGANKMRKDPDIKSESSFPVDESSLERGIDSKEDSTNQELQTEKNPMESSKVGTDLDEASLSNQISQSSLDSSPNVQVISESTGSQTNLTTAMYPNQPTQKHAVYNQWTTGMNSNVNNPYSYMPNSEGSASHSPSLSTSTAGNTGSMTSGYPPTMHRFPSPYSSGNSSSGFGAPEHMIRSPGSNTMTHPQAGGWFPGSRSDSKAWGNWSGANGQSYGMYGYSAGMNSKSTANSAPPGHHSSSQASLVHPTAGTKNSAQSPFHTNYPTTVNQVKGSPTSTSLHERPEKETSRNFAEAPSIYKVAHKAPKPMSMGVVKKTNSRIGPKSKVKSLKQKSQADEVEPIKLCQSPQFFQAYSPACDVQSSDYSDCDSQIENAPTLTLLKPKRRGSLGKDGAFVGPKRVKIAHQVKERQRKRHKELQEHIRQCELEEKMIAQKMEQADDQQSPLANVLLQSSILLSDKKVDGSDLVQQSIACIKAERNCSVDEDSSERELDRSSNLMNGHMQRRLFSRKNPKPGHDNSVLIRDFYRPRHSKKLRAKDFKWGQYVKNNRYWCGDCAHGFKSQKETTSHTEERCKANCLYMLECYVIVKDIHSHPFYGQKVQELLEEYQIDGQHNCATCGEIFEKKSDYLVHVDSHKDFMPWECTICGTRFKIRGSLKEHLRYTHMKGRVPCLKCNKVFPTSTLLRQHVKVHTQHYKYKSGKNREEELRAAMEATAGALEPSPGVASPEENDRLSSQEANEYRSWCKLMEINAMKNIATTGASVAGVNLQLEEDDDDRNDGDSLSGDDVAGSQLDYHSLDARGIMHS